MIIRSTQYSCRHCPSTAVAACCLSERVVVYYCYACYRGMRRREAAFGYPRMRVEWLSTRLVRRPTEMEMQLMKAYMTKNATVL